MSYHDGQPSLTEYHNSTVIRLCAHEGSNFYDEQQGLHYDICQDLATELLVTSGYEPEEEDDMGVAVSEDVQQLLTLAFFRAPALRERMEDILSTLPLDYPTTESEPEPRWQTPLQGYPESKEDSKS
jgi:hypothetical protein